MDAPTRRALRGLASRATEFLEPASPARGAAAIDDPFPDPQEAAARLAEAEALRRAREVELAEQRARAEAAEAQLAALRGTLSFGLGQALIEARTWRGLLRLPVRLIELRRAQRAKRRGQDSGPEEPAGSVARLVAEARARAADGGLEGARGWLRRRPGARRARGRALVELALDRVGSAPVQAAELGLEAARLSRGEPRLWVLADALHAAGLVRAPASLIEQAGPPPGGYRALAAAVERENRLLTAAGDPLPARSPGVGGGGGGVLIVAPAGAASSGDAIGQRVEEARRAALAAGLSVTIAVPAAPGDEQGHAIRTPQQDGSVLVRLAAAGAADTADALASLAQAESSALVHLVAGAHLAEEPIAEAARAAGLKLAVEVAVLEPWALAAEGERRGAALAALRQVARHADTIIVRAEPIAQVVEATGLAATRLPAPSPAVVRPDPQITADLRRELAIAEGAVVLGCVMPLVPDPGLVALIDALSELPPEALVLLAGSGPARAGLEARAADLGCAGRVRFAGPLLPGDLLPTLDLCQALLLPRRDGGAIASDPTGAVPLALGLGLPLVASAEEARWMGEAGGPVLPLEPGRLAALVPPPPRVPYGPGTPDLLGPLYRRLLG